MNTICDYCGKEFDAKKETALYCSNSHRTLANKQRRKTELANADIEKQRILELERRRQIADEKQKKREQEVESKRQEQEKRNEIARQLEENKRIQDERDVAALAEKNRKDEEDRQKLKEKQDADEKQHQADKLSKSIADRHKLDTELRDAERQVKLLGKLFVESLNNLSKHNIRSKHSTTKPIPLIGQISIPNTRNALPTINLHSDTNLLKVVHNHQPKNINGPAAPNKPEVTLQKGINILKPIKEEPERKTIMDDLSDLINIF